MNVSEVGRRPVTGAGVTTPASITVAYALVLPTTNVRGGVLECTVVIEGTLTSRYTVNGTTPTAAVGHLLPAPSATVPITLLLRGQAVIEAFRIIGTAGGNTVTYFFSVCDTR